MQKVSIDTIKKLREETSAGVIDVKKALEESGGNVDEAKKVLQEKGLARAAKRSQRQTSAGLVHAYIHANGSVGSLVEVNCETDFVARTDDFKELCHDLAMQVASMNPSSVKELEEQDFIKDSKMKVGEQVKAVMAKTGENIVVRRLVRFALDDDTEGPREDSKQR